VLIGILIPALGRARTKACGTSCLSNVRSLQIASMLYSFDHRGDLLEPGLPHGTGGLATEEIAWLNTLRDYAGGDLTVHSPCDRSPHWPTQEGGDGVPIPGTEDRFRRTSYGVNNYVTRYAPVEADFDDTQAEVEAQFFTNRRKIDSPTRTVQFLLMAETGEYAGADHVHAEDWWWRGQLIFDSDGLGRGVAEQMKVGAYGGPEAAPSSVSNYGFLDGHAEMTTFSAVYTSPEDNLFDPSLYR